LTIGGLFSPDERILLDRAPALRLALGTCHLPGPALIAPAFAAYLLTRLRVRPGPVRA
jgi:hypothetical protein